MAVDPVKQQLDYFFARLFKVLADNIKLQMTYLGQECVNMARDRGIDESWRDRTGNLRSSIGFAYYAEGRKLIESAFEAVSVTGQDGSQKGKDLVDELAKTLAKNYATLVVVAAMEYAEYVETKRDVLASTELYARSKIEECVRLAVTWTIEKINQEFK